MTLFGLCAQDYFSRAGHELLDWLGFIFDPADAINFLWYTAEGNAAMAAATAVAIVPAAGSFIAKGTKQAIKAGKKAAQKAGEKAARNATEKAAKKAAKKKLAKEATETGVEKAAKEAAEKATEKTAKETAEKAAEEAAEKGIKSGLNSGLLDELANSGVKYNPDDVVAITKNADGKLVWLENGNSNAGLEHIMQHAEQFATKGISSDKIPDFIMHALEEGKVVGTQRTRTIYEVMYEGKLQRVAISVGDNGFIVGANPKSIP